MPTSDSIESRLYEHVLGEGSPQTALLSTGVLSDEWAEMYVQLLKEAARKYEGEDSLPRVVVAAVHFASWYLNLRYDAWLRFENGVRNERTERNLVRVRIASEALLLSEPCRSTG